MKAQLDKKSKPKKINIDEVWEIIEPNAAGIDIGSKEHYVCVPKGRVDKPIRRFKTKTEDLQALVAWLKECGIDSVAMEATGVYWIPVYQMLERAGFKVLLVNARFSKNVSGRKSDVIDCEWIQKLHTFGLLSGSFRPADPILTVRHYTRYRDELIGDRSKQILHMQKALKQMNIQLPEVVSDISGATGLTIIEAILRGERDVLKLAGMADIRVRTKRSDIAKALVGDYQDCFLYQLKTAFDLFHHFQQLIAECEAKVAEAIKALPDRHKDKPLPAKINPKKKMDEIARHDLFTKLGVDITNIEGIGLTTGYVILSEIGPDVSAFKNEKCFASWLGLCPNNKISGGKVLRSKTKKNPNRVASSLRMAATTLERSQTAAGACYRRMVATLGKAEGITAVAHRLARLLYRLLKNGQEYIQEGLKQYEEKFQREKMRRLRKFAKSMNFELVPMQEVAAGVS